MSAGRTPRTVIEDLPAAEALTAEQMAAVVGAGPRRRLGLEALEDRTLMAASLTASFGSGVLRIEGTEGSDLIRVVQTSGLLSLGGTPIATAGGSVSQVSAAQVARIEVDALGGNDLIDVWSGGAWSGSTVIRAGAGDDLVDGGRGDDFVDGGAGDDKVWREGGSDTLVGTEVVGQASTRGVGRLLRDGSGTVFALSTGGLVSRRDAATGAWSYDGASGVAELAVDGSGRLYARAASGVVYRRDGANAWAYDGTSGAAELAVDGNGALFGRLASGVVYRRGATGAWAYDGFSGSADLAVDGGGTLLSRTASGVVYRRTANNAWSYDGASGVAELAVDGSGRLYARAASGVVYRRDGASAWAYDGASGVAELAVDGSGVLFGRLASGVVYRRGATGAWAYDGFSGSADLAVDGGGTLLSRTASGVVYRRDAVGGWVYDAFSGSAELAVDGNGTLYSRTTSGVVYRRDGTNAWAADGLSGAAELVADGSGRLYARMASGAVYWRDDANVRANAWAADGLSGAAELVADGSGTLFALIDDGKRVFRRDAANVRTNAWASEGFSGVAQIAVDGSGTLFALIDDGKRVFRRDGVNAWAYDGIGGVAQLAADGLGTLFVRLGDERVSRRDGANAWTVIDYFAERIDVVNGQLQTSYTPIGQKWRELGRDSGALGMPVGATNSGTHDGAAFQWQNFQGGVIYWSAATGAHAILGSPSDLSTFWGRFAASDFERGLGLPTGEVNDHGDGVKHQNFQKGVIYWSAATGAHAILGDPSDAGSFWGKFAALGYENGLGLPVGEVMDAGNGGTVQHFVLGSVYRNTSRGIAAGAWFHSEVAPSDLGLWGGLGQGWAHVRDSLVGADNLTASWAGDRIEGVIAGAKSAWVRSRDAVYEEVLRPLLQEAHGRSDYMNESYEPELILTGSGDPIYYVNGMATPHDVAVEEAKALAHLGRPVYLIYNGTSAVTSDVTECVKDYLWTELLTQHNPTTKALAGFLYRAAQTGTHVSLVSHSQGNLIVRNALKTLRLFEEEPWYHHDLAWVGTGSPISPEGYGVAKAKDLLRLGDPIVGLRDPMRFLATINYMSVSAHDFVSSYAHLVTLEQIWRREPRDYDPLEPTLAPAGTLILPLGDYYY